ncbi:hypothetical protein FKM82_031400 [Ascaphus truei]
MSDTHTSSLLSFINGQGGSYLQINPLCPFLILGLPLFSGYRGRSVSAALLSNLHPVPSQRPNRLHGTYAIVCPILRLHLAFCL